MFLDAREMIQVTHEHFGNIKDFSNSMYDLGSPVSAGPLQVVQLAEDLRLALELQPNQEDRDSLRAQLPTETAQALMDWLQTGTVNLCSPSNNETYQERLLRLEGDKESLVLQVSVLTDQVEAQGEKIRDLESSLEEHRQKLSSTEEMLQQELMSRTSLETQKLDLMDEVSYLKLKLVSMEETHTNANAQPPEPADAKQNKAEVWEEHRPVCVFVPLCGFHLLFASLFVSQDRRIEELTMLLSQYRKMREVMALTQGKNENLQPKNTNTHSSLHIFDEYTNPWGSPLSDRIRRSQSGSPVQVHDSDLGEFKRGGFRATAGPRLARSGNTRDLKVPFSKWNTEQVCDWLEDIGLGQYGILARPWVTSGQTLLSANTQDLEKELAIKNPLHRKKLQLAIKTFSSKLREKSAELDHIWVTRWLDDIGLPQYKDQFNEGRVDGQMLQYLTVNDLLFLKVTSQLHHLSIKCAIHVLHVNKFNANCLKRRPSNENQFTPSEVVQWSNHRVMEWLRSVDLAEYAPNLRGSGVHGGLIMLEPRFNSDTLAMLLNIPPQKTLLRRHLTTNFHSLVGGQAQQEKREYTEAPSYSPLSITAKVKPKKLGFSNLTHLRRRRPDDSTDYVCPIESSSGQSALNGVQVRPYAGFRGLSPILDREPDRPRDQVGLDDIFKSFYTRSFSTSSSLTNRTYSHTNTDNNTYY
uniref:PPFIA binding protein 2 n=1 Tax=Sphaeramia orbicularis TaxID=375764 RepID=A0A672ZYX3_9TELE